MFGGMKSSAASNTEQIWRERVRQWRASGETAEQFARHKGFAPSTLRWWSSRLGSPERTTFVRLVPKPVAPTAAPEVLVEIGAARVRVAAGFDAALLADVVRVLSGAKP